MNEDLTFLSEYYADDGSERSAIIGRDQHGFVVELYEGNELKETRCVYNHSEAYAEDVAENWCQGMIQL